MKSELHSRLQDKAKDYLLAKTYWIKALEMPTPIGIIDAWGISRSRNFETCAIEVKVSKNDFRSRSQKYKEYNSGMIANKCYILCPAGLIQPEEVHPYWGLLWYEEGQKLINKKKPTFLKMTDRQKLEILIHFLSSGVNNPPTL
jgi:hypothetical protein